jgi:hypothetical protein
MAIATPVALTGNDQQVWPASGAAQAVGTYKGVTLRETAGAAAVVRIYDGTSAAGTLLDTIALAASQSVSLDYPEGIAVRTGIYVSKVSGAFEGSVRLG